MKTNRKLPVDERRMDNGCEYILELRTERIQVGCDGKTPRIVCQGIV